MIYYVTVLWSSFGDSAQHCSRDVRWARNEADLYEGIAAEYWITSRAKVHSVDIYWTAT